MTFGQIFTLCYCALVVGWWVAVIEFKYNLNVGWGFKISFFLLTSTLFNLILQGKLF